ncbi:MAG: hypothetical protein V4812_14230 [Pseudomonadota bacterium]
MYTFLKIAVVLWGWGCWAWVAFSQQWLWLGLSIIPYILFNRFGHLLDKHAE